MFFLTSSGIYAVVMLKDGESDSGEETAQSLKQLLKEDWLLCCPSACYGMCDVPIFISCCMGSTGSHCKTHYSNQGHVFPLMFDTLGPGHMFP